MRATLDRVKQRRLIVGAGAAVVVLISAVLVYVGLRSADDPKAAPSPTATATATRTATPTNTPLASPTPVRWASILNGRPLTEQEWNERKDLLPIAVMLDNTPNSAPHAGLDRADVIYEAFVEGGITRLMAVYWSQEADLIEPVRSARTPFVVWADELGAMYGHAGSADTDNDADAAGQLFEWKIFDLNAFTPGPSTAYYRDNDRYAPYNLATATGWLREAGQRMGYAGPPRVEPWPFKADGEGTGDRPAAGGIQISFQDRPVAWQTVQWKWNDATRSYLRSQFGGPVTEATTGDQIAARTVVVMRAGWRVVDSSGHVLIDQIGEGEATVFLDGRAIAGTWKKADRQARTRFFDASGNEISFNRGPIWIEVAGPASDIVVTEKAGDLPELPPYTPPPPGSVPETPDEEPTAATPEPTATPTTGASPTTSATSTPTTGASPTASVTPVTSTPEPSPSATGTEPPPEPTESGTP